VGLPVAVALARRFAGTIGFDINPARIEELQRGIDRTGEIDPSALRESGLVLTQDVTRIVDATFYIVTVPTPVDENKKPDLGPVRSACMTVGKAIRPGAVVVFESTVYPGVTEEVCGPLLESVSGLKCGKDFFLGYSPERINPGDKVHRLESIIKVVSGQDAATLDRVAAVYGSIVSAGVHRAPSIKVAEAAKVIENTQRDLNIALMNELALIFDRMGIRTTDVLRAAGTKWNFMRFSPGLVGGHCIGVDPYYLTAKAETLGYYPQVIHAGRRINDGMGAFVAQKLVKLMVARGKTVRGSKVGILGVTFKEDVPDVRNSRVPDVVHELREFGVEPIVSDLLADPAEVRHEYGIELSPFERFEGLDALVLAVPHRKYIDDSVRTVSTLGLNGVLIDIKSALPLESVRSDIVHWSL
jgi:UDP-N-acetyl-D-galactosamine dehydrogenase